LAIVLGVASFVVSANATADQLPPPAAPTSAAPSSAAPASATPSPASAIGVGSPVPIRLVDRPLTMPIGVVRGDLALYFQHPRTWGGAISAGYGVTDDLELDATIIPMTFAPTVQYGDPSLSGTYRFFNQPAVEIGLFLGVTVLTHDDDIRGYFNVDPGIPILVRLGEIVRVDTGLFVPVTFGGHPGTVLSAIVPVRATLQITDPLYVGANTGLGIADFSHPGDTIYAPLGIFGGYAISLGCTALVDLSAHIGFPDLYVSGVRGNTVTDNWVTGVTASVYAPLGPAAKCGAGTR
jgi:hypothetical protein